MARSASRLKKTAIFGAVTGYDIRPQLGRESFGCDVDNYPARSASRNLP